MKISNRKFAGRTLFFALVAFAAAITVNGADARNRCSSDNDCTGADRCIRYSSSVFVDCNALGRAFGCKSTAGGCSLFCTNESLFQLACSSRCTSNAQCLQGEKCATGSGRRFCVKR